MSVCYVYLLQEREFVNSGEDIYKIGKTKKLNFTRFKQYPKGSILLFQSTCNDCHTMEKTILSIFIKKFIQRTDIGSEYFEGNYKNMIKIIMKCIEKEKDLSESFSDSELDDIEVYQCIYCYDLFEFAESLQEHNKTKCVDKYQCNLCKKKYKIRKDYNCHKNLKNPCVIFENKDDEYVCNLCNKGFKNARYFKTHEKTCSSNKNEKIDALKIELQKQEDENNERIIEFKKKILKNRKLEQEKDNKKQEIKNKKQEIKNKKQENDKINKKQEKDNSKLLHKLIDMIEELNKNKGKNFDKLEHLSDSESNTE